MLFALLGGVVAFLVAAAGSTLLGLAAGLVCLVVALAVIAWRTKLDPDHDPGRRRFLTLAGLGGLAWLFVGDALGRAARGLAYPDPRPVQQAMAHDLGAEYMELVRRAYHPGRSGDIQLLLAPFNSSNYATESLQPRALLPEHQPRLGVDVPRARAAGDPRSREGRARSDSAERVTLADLAPTTAAPHGVPTIGRQDRAGVRSSTSPPSNGRPRSIVTFVIDGGGWNVLQQWPGRWPHLERLMGQGANFRNAITGSFPAVTACAHATIGTGTFPNQHGVTGHNIRDGSKVRKVYGKAGHANPGDILIPTLADLWSDATDNRAWVGEIGYQVWHMGMIGHGGPSRRRRRAPGRRLLGRVAVQGERHRWMGAAQPRSVPAPRRARRTWMCTGRTPPRFIAPGLGRAVHADRASNRRAAARRWCGTRAT